MGTLQVDADIHMYYSAIQHMQDEAHLFWTLFTGWSFHYVLQCFLFIYIDCVWYWKYMVLVHNAFWAADWWGSEKET